LGGSALYLATAHKTYSATAVVYVSVAGSNNSVDLQQASTFSQQAATNYAAITKSPLVLGPVISQLKLSVSSASLAKTLQVTAEAGTSLFDITAVASTPAKAAQIANAVAASATLNIGELEAPSTPAATPLVVLKQIQTATVPNGPSTPVRNTAIAFGGIVGLVLGIALAILLYILDTRIRSVRDIHQITERPLLATVPRRKGKDGALVVKDFPNSVAGEAFRGLRTNLRFVEVAHNRSFVIAAAAPLDRSHHVAANLAWTLAETGSTVVLVDIDLRQPHVHTTFGLSDDKGVTDIVAGNATMPEVVRSGGLDTLSIVSAGTRTTNPSELLGSEEMRRFVEQLEASFDFVIFDGPPLLSYTDTAVVSALTTGAVIVVQAGRSRRRELKESITVLSNVNLQPVGIVLSGA
jgi:succinoglycan biosynthesis transport protein ExoP